MVEIYIKDNDFFILPLKSSSLADAVRIYNCGRDIRYATGHEGSFTVQELASLLERIKASDDEFITGIYVKAPGGCEGTQLMFAGLCSGILHAGSMWIKQLSVLPEYRRQGIGTRTMAVLSEYAMRYFKVHEIFISVAEKNITGLYFWKKIGFHETHRIKKELFDEESPQNVIIMQKNLT